MPSSSQQVWPAAASLAALRVAFPAYDITADYRRDPPRYAATAHDLRTSPWAYVTDDLSQLAEVLAGHTGPVGVTGSGTGRGGSRTDVGGRPVGAVAIWAGTLPRAEAEWLAGDRGPLSATGGSGGIGHDGAGNLVLDQAAVDQLSQLRPEMDGACRQAGDGTVRIQAGGAWYRLRST